jgi:DNA mismatch repair protein MutS2
MKFFPESTPAQIEFDKVKELIALYCRTEYGQKKVENLRVHTRKDFVELELAQSYEFKSILDVGLYFPNDFTPNISKTLKLLSISGAMLTADQFVLIRKLSDNTQQIFRWFDDERRIAYNALSKVLDSSYFEKAIREMIDDVLDDTGMVKDNASETLTDIRMKLYRKRNELRKVFEKIVSKLNKAGYLADIEESFMNGRKVLAVFAEHKRMIKGILHAESDSRRTSFIEPEETMGLNNEIFSLENEETIEVRRILLLLTAQLSIYAPLLSRYADIAGEFDFIRAKAKFAQDINGEKPRIHDKPIVSLFRAFHPLLLLYNKKQNKPTIPVTICLDDKQRILVISGPNAGGKTVTLKTIALLQIMFQSGLLISTSPDSELGIFKQMMMHIGDTQSLEFELSTYSAHLTHMKHFIENANGKTLFFIDELGSGSDPNLGGAFAEVIVEELAIKHSLGVVTTHYLNLKIMANKLAGVFNGAMQFDEEKLLPLYQLKIGAPGSSYTFSIAERIGLDKRLIDKARKRVDENQFQLDKLLNQTEQLQQSLSKDKSDLHVLMKENEKLKRELETTLNKEKHQQEVERLTQKNKISEEKLTYLRDAERKLKALVVEWRKSDQKDEVIKLIHQTLTGQKQHFQTEKHKKTIQQKFDEVGGKIEVGCMVNMKKNRQIGMVKEIRGKKALLQVGLVPMLVSISDLVVVQIKESENPDSPNNKK